MKPPTLKPPGRPFGAAAKFLDEVSPLLFNLYERWQDEHEYEDLNDYRVPIEALASPHGYQILEMTESPFGFKASIDGTVFHFRTQAKGRYLNNSVLRCAS